MIPRKAYSPLTQSVVELSEAQGKVLAAFDSQGDLTDFKLGYAYRLTHGSLDQSWSGLRTRRSELVKMGVLTSVGTVLNERNRPLNIWGITYGAYVCG
jgi:tRNA A37 threonylcarbamoyltransferase TsaD